MYSPFSAKSQTYGLLRFLSLNLLHVLPKRGQRHIKSLFFAHFRRSIIKTSTAIIHTYCNMKLQKVMACCRSPASICFHSTFKLCYMHARRVWSNLWPLYSFYHRPSTSLNHGLSTSKNSSTQLPSLTYRGDTQVAGSTASVLISDQWLF